ncbi:MAG: arginine--tRNA ligase, partial [Dinoroseobacter sp.]|nr:arginine--tRNA ligase [Dinoroseobacter sp.]
MSLFQQIRARVVQALDDMASQGQLPEGLNLTAVTVEPPRDPAHGDMATNAAMVLAKGAGQKPRDIATTLAEHLLKDELIDAADVAGPGFLNLRLNPSVWQSVVAQV